MEMTYAGCPDPASTIPFGSTGNIHLVRHGHQLYSHFRRTHTSGVLTFPVYSHFQGTYAPLVVTLLKKRLWSFIGGVM